MATVKKLKKPASPKKQTLLSHTAPSDIQLPDGPNEPSNNMEDYTFLIYGERKIGKTTLVSQFDEPYFIMFEPGGNALRIKSSYCPDWQTFLVLIDRLSQRPDYCKTVVIDTGYMAYERCFEYIVDKHELSDIRDKGWGTGWKMVDREFREAHQRLAALGLSYVVIAHSEVKDIPVQGGGVKEKFVLQLGAQANRLYGAIVDVTAYYHYSRLNKRVLTIEGSNKVDAGSRVEGHFLYTDGMPIKDIPMGKSKKEAYKNLTLAFHNKLERGGDDDPEEGKARRPLKRLTS